MNMKYMAIYLPVSKDILVSSNPDKILGSVTAFHNEGPLEKRLLLEKRLSEGPLKNGFCRRATLLKYMK